MKTSDHARVNTSLCDLAVIALIFVLTSAEWAWDKVHGRRGGGMFMWRGA